MDGGSGSQTAGGSGSQSSNTSKASKPNGETSSSSSALKDKSSEMKTDTSKGTPKSTLGGFSVVSPGFDPDDKDSILNHYGKKKDKGVLPKENQFEDSVEDEIKKAIADWEAVSKKKATPEQRKRMGDKIRRIRGGAWLESLKPTLVGQTHVPIEFFNRLAEQHEATILSTMRYMSDASKHVDGKDKEIEDLRKKLNDKPSASNSSSNTGELTKLQRENARLKGINEALKKDTQKSDDMATDLQEKLDQRVRKVSQLEAEIEKLKAAAKKTSKEGGSGDIHSACKAEISELKQKLNLANTSKGKGTEKAEGASKGKKTCERLESECQTEKATMKKEIGELKEQLKQAQDDLQSTLDGILGGTKPAEEGHGSTSDVNVKIHEELKKELTRTKKRVEKSEKQNKELSVKLAKAQASTPDSITQERKKFKKEISGLRGQVGDLQARLKTATQALSPADAQKVDYVAVINKLRDDIAVISKARDKFRNDFMARFTEAEHARHLTTFWQIVEDTRAAMGEIQQLAETLFQNLGMNAPYTDAKDALNQMIKASTMATGASPAMQLVTSKLAARSLEVKVYQLREQLANAPSRKTDEEIKMELGVYNEAEMQRRVSAQTQVYRLHRRAYLENFFSADGELAQIATNTPHGGTRELINQVRARYLDPMSLPMPPAPTVDRG
ncbi:hypothetical protein F5X96DRAFT_692046 [Biscogniauxia mediterranea]|nr:hypothetical protein F5X96DRAFT_692046 [Biscogniauxia mediterranea]